MLKRRRLSCVALAIFCAACTISETPAPPLTGPSEYGLSLGISVDRDLLVRNGRDSSTVIVTAHNDQGAPFRDLKVRLEILVQGQVADTFGTLLPNLISTGGDGRAIATYTVPPAPSVGASAIDLVTIRASTIGTNYQLSKSQVVDIKLVPSTVNTPGAPVALFDHNPTSGITPLMHVDFDGSRSFVVTGSRIVNYVWDWGDGSPIDGDNGANPVEDHDWEKGGTYPVTLTVIDDRNQAGSTTQYITVK